MKKKTAIIVGAGPGGLTAALELLEKTDIQPVIYEASSKIGGISRTETYKGNYLDIGGHRFFTKHKKILDWWLSFLPLQAGPAEMNQSILNHASLDSQAGPDPEQTNRVMLVRRRFSRILFHGQFFDYPLRLDFRLFLRLGLCNSLLICLGFLKSKGLPVRPEQTLEDFFINRFGRRLYEIFFRDYSHKLWGVHCRQISADWGSQRIKGMSMAAVIRDALRRKWPGAFGRGVSQQEISLIEKFFYPKFGPGQLWETVAAQIQARGGQIYLNHQVSGFDWNASEINAVQVKNHLTGECFKCAGDYVLSTMPLQDLIHRLGGRVPPQVQALAAGLYYRDLIVVGLLFKKLDFHIDNSVGQSQRAAIIPDCWLYIQDQHIQVGRLQIFNNWNPYMVADPETVWMGAEICCSHSDAIWQSPDQVVINQTVRELEQLGLVDPDDFLDAVVVRQPKAYPGYTGVYQQLGQIRRFVDSFDNLFLVGRNGLHRYNNMDHSMLTAMKAVENIVDGKVAKDNIWDVNVEDEYHELY